MRTNVDTVLPVPGGLDVMGGSQPVDVNLLFEGAEGTVGADYMATSSAPAVVTVEVTDNPRVVITPVAAGTATIEVTFPSSGAMVQFDVAVLPTWILLQDSLTVSRGIIGLMRSGRGPDNSGGWGLQWARWYYPADNRNHTVVQFYSTGSWAYGGSSTVGCRTLNQSSEDVGEGYLNPSGTAQNTRGVVLLDSDTSVVRRDASGNVVTRVPAGDSDDPARLWTMRLMRRTGDTRITSHCKNNTNWVGQLYYTDVPQPPSS